MPHGRVGTGDPNSNRLPNGFGPYPLLRVGGRVELTLGLEIANKIEGYTSLRLNVGRHEGHIT